MDAQLQARFDELDEALGDVSEGGDPSFDVAGLVARYPALLTMTDSLDRRPLHKAASYGTIGQLEALLTAGADIEVRTGNITAQTALHKAVQQGRADVVALLLRRGADPDARDGFGMTALVSTRYLEQDHLVPVLLAGGATLDLRAAVNLRDCAAFAALLAADPEAARRPPDSLDIVAEAVSAGMEYLTPLLEEGGDPNTAVVSALALHEAIFYDKPEAARLLMRYGADPDRRKSPTATSPREYAERNRIRWALELFGRTAQS